MSATNLVVCGSIAIDRIMNFGGSYADVIDPAQLDVLSVSVLVDSLTQARGGTGANIAYNFASLGGNPVLLGSAGINDADDYMEFLGDLGVHNAAVHYSQLPTASFTVLTDGAGNQVGGFYPGAMSDADDVSFQHWGETKQDVLCCISAHDPKAMRRQVEECVDYSLRLMYDPGQQVSNLPGEDLAAGLAAAEIVFVNEYELSVLATKTGKSADDIQAGVKIFVTTHGAEGSRITGSSITEPIKVQVSKPAKIVDPTGAGDAYRAGFLYGYLRQWDLIQCAQLASVVASFVLEQAGPQVALSLPTIVQRYQQTYNQEITL